MTESLRSRALAIAFAVGVVLALATALGGLPAALGAALAQPAFALGISWWRRTRPVHPPARLLRQDVPALLAPWLAGPLLLAALVAWPLSALHDSGSLAAVLGLSVAVSAALLGVWRTWPLWNEIERTDGSLSAHWQALSGRDLSAWRGLAVAAVVVGVCALVVLPAWPGLVSDGMRWPLTAAVVVLSPLAHLLLQAIAPASSLAARSSFDVDGHGADALANHDAAPQPLEPLAQHEHLPALYDAARSGRVDRALQLLAAGADPHGVPDPAWRDQRNLPVLAAVLPDLRLLRELIARGVDVNAPHRGMTPLLAATRDSWHGRPEAVMTLLANGADSRAVDSEGNTPLHHAARSSDPGVAALLRDAAAEVDALNQEGWSPLAVACQVGNWRLARFLLERGAKTEPVDGTPVLLAAAGTEEDDPAGVQLLLKHKARADARDRQRRSALHEAALAGHVDIIDVLLAAGANLESRDALSRTPWLEAARGGRAAVIEHLLPHHPDLNAVDLDGRNAVLLACMADSVSPLLVRRLLELGVAADTPDPQGRRAVDIAASAGRWTIVSLLDRSYPLPAAVTDGLAAVDADPTTPSLPDRPPLDLLREALGFGNVDGMAALARLCDPLELGGLLHDAELALDPQAVDWLLANGAAPEVLDACGDTPMFALLARGIDAVPALQALLRRGLSPAGRGGLARLLAACAQHDHASRGLEQLALELLERGADPFAPSPAGDPPLSLAVRLGWLRLQQALLLLGVDREARDSHGMTALHLATALAREGSLKLLVQQGASPEARAADGQTPLGVALSIGRRDLADWLDWRVWPLPRRALRDGDLPAAAMSGDADAVRRLIDLGFGVDVVDAQGCTALLRAAGGGHLAVADLLLARGANPQHAAASGATPLSAAVSMRQIEIVSALLDAGAELEYRLPGGVTVLMLASALGLPDIVARLLTAGANVHAGDAQQLGPLHCAALYGFSARDRSRLLALLDTLLLAGAEPDQAAAGAVTPLLLLLGARAEPGTACDEQVVLAAVERLLDEDVSLDVRDPRGFGPLHLAALHGLPLLVQRLLRAGADLDVRDALNRTPREIAVMRGFIDVAGEFEPRVPGVSSMARFLRDNG